MNQDVDRVKVYFPGCTWKSLDKSFNWFFCSKRRFDYPSGMYVIVLSKNARFYCEKTGKDLRIGNPSQTQVRLLLLSDNHNKQRLKEIGCSVKCNSKKCVTTTTCVKIRHSKYLTDASTLAFNLGFEGVVEDNSQKNSVFPLIHNDSTLVIRRGILEEDIPCPGECSRIVAWCTTNNRLLTNKIPNFPNIEEIRSMRNVLKTSDINKRLIKKLRKKPIKNDNQL